MSISMMTFSATPVAVSAYAQQMLAAALAVAIDLFALKPPRRPATPARKPRARSGKPRTNNEVSLFRLYWLACEASSYDWMSPALAEELRVIAARP
jgi:hypothetical protein